MAIDQTLADRIQKIEERNARVEIEKAWEVSWARFFTNTVATYLIMNLLLWTIGDSLPLLHALVPTLGYILSTLSIPYLKKWWIGESKA